MSSKKNNKEYRFIEISHKQSGLGDGSCPDGEVESIVMSRTGEWIDPDSVKGMGIGDSADKTIVVSNPSPGSGLTPGGQFKPSVSTIVASEPPLDLPQPPDMGKSPTTLPEVLQPHVPLFEFSLAQKPVTPYSLLADQWPQMEVNLPVPPSDPELYNLLTSTATEFIEDYEMACRNQKLFTAPFLVMCALRFPDGTRVPGMPVLMIPNSETPPLTVETLGSSDQATGLRLKLLSRACQLKMCLLDSPNTDTRVLESQKGCRVEILVAGPVTLRHGGPYEVRKPHTVFANGYSVTESGVVRTSGGERLTGLSLGNVSRDEIDASISTLSEFRVIASIPYENISDYSVPTPVPISGSVSSEGYTQEKIKPDYSLLMRHIPEYATEVNSHLLLMGGECMPPLPVPLRGAVATGSRTGTLQEVTLEVELIKEGRRLRRRLSPDMAFGEHSPYVMPDLENQFPKFIFYPDSDAFLLRIASRINGETRVRTLPLVHHESLGGSYWFSGLYGDSPSYTIGELRGIPTESESSYPTPWLTSVSTVSYSDTPLRLFPASGRVRCGNTHVLGATASVRSLSSGQLGVFPLQLFTDEGIWAVAHDAEGGGFHAVQPISLHHCVNPAAIVPTPYGTVFCTLSGVMLLNGTQTKTLTDECPAKFSPDYLTSCRIWYDAEREHLHVFQPGSSRTEVYCLLTGKWLGYTDSEWTSGGGIGGLWGNIGGIGGILPPDILPGIGSQWSGPVHAVESWWQLTLRPIKMKEPHSRKRLRGIKIVSVDASDVKVRIWGASIGGEWHPLAEGEGEVRSLFGSGWQLFRVSVLYRGFSSSLEGLLVSCGVQTRKD